MNDKYAIARADLPREIFIDNGPRVELRWRRKHVTAIVDRGEEIDDVLMRWWPTTGTVTGSHMSQRLGKCKTAKEFVALVERAAMPAVEPAITTPRQRSTPYTTKIIKQKHEHILVGARTFAEAVGSLNYGFTYALCRDGVPRFEVKDSGGVVVVPLDVEVEDLIAWGQWLDSTGRTDPAYMVRAARELTEMVLSTAPTNPLALVVESLTDPTGHSHGEPRQWVRALISASVTGR